VDKAPDAFRTISEVAEELDLPQHVLRFWETRFSQIKPMKRGGGRRYYRPDDVELLKGIRHLLYGEGYTIKGVQRILKDQGLRFVMDLWRNPGTPIPSGPGPALEEGDDERETGLFDQAGPEEADIPHPEQSLPKPPRMAPRPTPEPPPAHESLPAGILPEGAPQRTGLRLMDRLRSVAGGLPQAHSEPVPTGALSRDDIRRLQSTLFELLECKRLLDQTR
jgi:DNA-binding transcriptional MerR regulator